MKPCGGLCPPMHVWRLRLAMNGTRASLKAFGDSVNHHVCECGLDEIKIAPMVFRSEVRDLDSLVHGDDFFAQSYLRSRSIPTTRSA